MATGTLLRSWALVEQGEVEDGIAQLESGLSSSASAIGSEVAPPWFLALLMEAHVKVRQPDQGLEFVAAALTYSKKYPGSHWEETEIYHLKGELQLLRGDPEAAAEIDFRQAVDIARRQKARSLQLRGAISLSLLLGAQGRSEEAHQSLSEIYGWFSEGSGTRDLIEARGLLEELALG